MLHLSRVLKGSLLILVLLALGCSNDNEVPGNKPPTVPKLVSPNDKAKNVSLTPTLKWLASTDAEGDAITYTVYLDTVSQNLKEVKKDLKEVSYDTETLLANKMYYWQVKARDKKGGESVSSLFRFTTKEVTTNNTPPTKPNLLSPVNNATGIEALPTFNWSASTDADGDTVRYDILLGEITPPTNVVHSSDTVTTFTGTGELSGNTVYYWQVKAKDGEGGSTSSDIFSFTTDSANFVTIPDTNFRAYLREQFPNAFNLEDKMNVNHTSVTDFQGSINVVGLNIRSLEGIEYFKALTELICSSNQLSSLDVSKNTALTYLVCKTNQLSRLDVSKNTALTYLACSINSLTSLDVSRNTALTYLDCKINKLSRLDVSKNTVLKTLLCYMNELSSLDVSKNTVLKTLLCYTNQLSRLDVSKNTALISLGCGGNNLSRLDVSKNTALTILDCQGNQLDSLDLRGMRSVAHVSGFVINAGVDGKNLLSDLKVHKNLQTNSEIKEVKTNRGTNVMISTWSADADSTIYTKECSNFDPNTGTNGTCGD